MFQRKTHPFPTNDKFSKKSQLSGLKIPQIDASYCMLYSSISNFHTGLQNYELALMMTQFSTWKWRIIEEKWVGFPLEHMLIVYPWLLIFVSIKLYKNSLLTTIKLQLFQGKTHPFSTNEECILKVWIFSPKNSSKTRILLHSIQQYS